MAPGKLILNLHLLGFLYVQYEKNPSVISEFWAKQGSKNNLQCNSILYSIHPVTLHTPTRDLPSYSAIFYPLITDHPCLQGLLSHGHMLCEAFPRLQLKSQAWEWNLRLLILSPKLSQIKNKKSSCFLSNSICSLSNYQGNYSVSNVLSGVV